MTKIKAAGYVKLAKLWEKNKENAIIYHNKFYADKFSNLPNFDLIDVYIDITGKKEIFNRSEMIRLLLDIKLQRVECIYTQTKAYLAANTKEFFYLIKYLFELNENINIVTEDKDYNINTYINDDFQKEEMLKLAGHYATIYSNDYLEWKQKIESAILNFEKDLNKKKADFISVEN